MAGEVMTGVLGPSERVNLNDPRFVMSGDAPLAVSCYAVLPDIMDTAACLAYNPDWSRFDSLARIE